MCAATSHALRVAACHAPLLSSSAFLSHQRSFAAIIFFSGGFDAQSRINFEEDHEAQTFSGSFSRAAAGADASATFALTSLPLSGGGLGGMVWTMRRE